MFLLSACTGRRLEVPIVRNAERQQCILCRVRNEAPCKIKNEQRGDEEDLS